ncbi:MAG: 2'-deoxycytidine 5'-triphosphate deaminase domain-containing protein [Candidatus Woesearchaeota archaeon]
MALIPKNIVDYQLKELAGAIIHVDNVSLEEHIQPASIDLPIGKTAYLVENGFLPFKETIQSIVRQEGFIIEEYDLTKKTRLTKNKTYLIPLLSVSLPEHMEAGMMSWLEVTA